jgi:protein-tyrosine phosphatase
MELLPSVFLGDKSLAGNLEWLRTNSIGAIVNVTWEVRNFFEFKKGSSDSLSITSSNDGINMNTSSPSQSSELVLQDSMNSSILKEEKEEERRTTPDSRLPADDNKHQLSEELKETDEGSSSPSSIKREENEEELLPVCATTPLVDISSSSSSIDSISLDIPDILYKRVPVTDSQETKLDAFFDETADFISAQVQEGKKVLVHCQLGMSRSPSILIAYAIRSLGMTLSSAVESISKSTLNINDGFQRQVDSPLSSLLSLLLSYFFSSLFPIILPFSPLPLSYRFSLLLFLVDAIRVEETWT